MADYDWKNILKTKTDKELLTVYRGDSHVGFEAEIIAGLELKNRNYDKEVIDEIYQQKLKQLDIDKETFNNINYKESKQYKYQINSGIGFVIIAIVLILRYFNIIFTGNFHYLKAYLFLGILFIAFFGTRWYFFNNKKQQQKSITKRTELLKMLSTSNHE